MGTWQTEQRVVVRWSARALGLALVLSAAALCIARAGESLANPGFEAWPDKLPQGWLSDSNLTKADGARSGTLAVKLGAGMRLYQCLALEPGFLYRGSVWARGKGTLTLGFYEYKDGIGQGYASAVSTEALPLTEQWQQFLFTYSQGPAEAHLKGIAFAISTGRDGSEAVVDDASIDKTLFPTAPPNLLLNSEFADADKDGLPEQWQGERRRLRIEPGPNGLRVVRLAGTLFSEDFQPAPDFKDWWDWSRWGEQHGSGWPALPRPLGGAYTVMFESAPVPVEPGQRYDVRLLLRELEVYGEFVAVRWFGAERKPLAEFEERLAYHHMEGHSGDWVSYTGRVTAAQKARFAAVVVGCKQSSGAIWVAQPALCLGLGAPGRHEPRFERQPGAIKQGVPRVDATPATPVRVGKTKTGVGVEVSAGKLRIALGDAAVVMPLRDGRLIGITSVTAKGVALRNPHAPPLAPLVQTTPPRRYTECVYENWEVQRDRNQCEEIVVHSSLRTADGSKDRLDWILVPGPVPAGAGPNAALPMFDYAYAFQSDQVRLMRLMDRATWEVGGMPARLRIGEAGLPLTRTAQYCLACADRFVGSEAFDFQTGPAGTLRVSSIAPDCLRPALFLRAATPEFVIHQDTYLFPEVPAGATPRRTVSFGREVLGPDEWAFRRDGLVDIQRRQLGAPPERPLEPAAMFLGYGGLRGIGDLRPDDPKIKQADYYRWVADHAVPRLADLGFKRVMMVLPRGPWNWPIEDINHLCPDTIEPFKYLCDAAQRRGMTVMAWYGTSQNLDKAAVWAEHPEFILKTPTGERARAYYSPWGWPGKLAAGYAEYTLAGLKEVREKTGLAGLWLDSYNAGYNVEGAVFKDMVEQMNAFLPWHAAIENLGYYTYCEGAPHVIGTISDSGWTPPEDWSRFRPEAYYKQGLYLQQPWGKSTLPLEISETGRFLADPETFHYYRLLANGCCPILDLGHFGTDTAAMDRIAQANRDYTAVSDLLGTRHLLGDDGVEWVAKTPADRAGADRDRAVFAFRDFEYRLTKGATVLDVTSGQPVAAKGKTAQFTRYHTYRLPPRPGE